MAMICGKGLPPRAAFLLTVDFICLVIVAPVMFLAPELAATPARSFAAIVWSLAQLMAIGFLCQALFYYNELYNLRLVRSVMDMLSGVFRAFALILLIIAIALQVLSQNTLPLSRVLSLTLFLLCVATCVRMFLLPRRRERTLILGAGEETAELHETVDNHPEWNVQVVEIMNPSVMDDYLPREKDASLDYDRIIVCNGKPRSLKLLDRLLTFRMRGLLIEDSQAFYERSTGRMRVDGLTLEQCVFTRNGEIGIYARGGKRIFDIVMASLLFLLASPIIAIVALVIWAQGDGGILFTQQRSGLYGRPFQIIKFRTMKTSAPGSEAKWATEETARISSLGAFLRKYRLDELLQLINIIRGDMSLVGPRPEQPEFCRMLEEHLPFYDVRHSVLPGLTGWAQVRYHYGSGIEESKRKLEYDLFYVKHISLWLDCAVVIETVKVVLVGRGAM